MRILEISKTDRNARFGADRERTARIEDETLLDENGDPCDMDDSFEDVLDEMDYKKMLFISETDSNTCSEPKPDTDAKTESSGNTDSTGSSGDTKGKRKKKSDSTNRTRKRAASKRKTVQESEGKEEETADQNGESEGQKKPRTWTTRQKGDQAEAIKNVVHHEYKLTFTRPDGTLDVRTQDTPFTEEDVSRILGELFPGRKVEKIDIHDGQYELNYVEYLVATHLCTVEYSLLVPEKSEPEVNSETVESEPEANLETVESGDDSTAEPASVPETPTEDKQSVSKDAGCSKSHSGKASGKKGKGCKAKKARYRRRKGQKKPKQKYRKVKGKMAAGQTYRRNSHVSPSLLAKVLSMHFVLMVSVFRIVAMIWQKGLGVSQGAVYNWISIAAADLLPLARFLLEELKTYGYLHADESPGLVFREPGRNNETKSYFWFYVTAVGAPHPVCVIKYHPGRKGEFPEEDLKGWSGKLITDAFQGYNGLLSATRCLCMAHARRYFFIAAQFSCTRLRREKAKQIVALFTQLFANERVYKAEGLSPEKVLERRTKESAKIFERIDQLSREIMANSSCKSSQLFRAANYFCNNKEGLSQFLKDGRVPLSNNRCERMVKPFSLFRANCLFSGSPRGATNTATCLSIVRTAELNGLDAQSYLEYVFTRIQETPVEQRNNREFLASIAPWAELPQTHCGKISRNNTEKPETFREVA